MYVVERKCPRENTSAEESMREIKSNRKEGMDRKRKEGNGRKEGKSVPGRRDREGKGTRKIKKRF